MGGGQSTDMETEIGIGIGEFIFGILSEHRIRNKATTDVAYHNNYAVYAQCLRHSAISAVTRNGVVVAGARRLLWYACICATTTRN